MLWLRDRRHCLVRTILESDYDYRSVGLDDSLYRSWGFYYIWVDTLCIDVVPIGMRDGPSGKSAQSTIS